MADATWIASTLAKASAAPLDGTEIIRLIDDVATTPVSKQAAISAIRAYLIAAANPWTAAQTLNGTTLGFSGNQSKPAWTIAGAKLLDAPGTLTDTTSSGTVADARTNVLGGDTIAASAATTFTDYYSAFFSQPVAGSNVTLTNRWALGLLGGLKSSGQSLTGSQAQSLIDLATTWNTSGAPTALKLNVTDTASNAASLLADFQVGGSSQATITKAGTIRARWPGANTPGLGFVDETNTGIGMSVATGGHLDFILRGVVVAQGYANTNGWRTPVITLGDVNTNETDLVIRRDAAGVFAQRNGTNAQTLRWYHTFTDLSNRQNGALKTAAGYVEVAAETAGTGADDLDVLLTPAGTGNVRFGTHAAIGIQTVTGYIEIKDAGGTARRLAVVS